MKNDFKDRMRRVKEAACSQLPSLLREIFPAGKIVGSQFLIGNIHGDAGESLKIELNAPRAGFWIDFANISSKGNIFDLLARYFNLDIKAEFPSLLEKAEIHFGLAVNSNDISASIPEWIYRDLKGKPWIKIKRINKDKTKTFRAYDIERKAWKMPNPRPLYNLPNIINEQEIVFVEGEKCAQALIDAGIVATTCMGGANAVGKADFLHMEGKKVIIWPDKDDAGSKYAQDIADKIFAIGGIAKILIPPENKPHKWDAADAIIEGFDYKSFIFNSSIVEEVRASINNSRIFNLIKISDFLTSIQPQSWIVEGLIARNSLVTIFGEPAAGKSLLALDLACCVASGKDFHGRETKKGGVVYIAGEGHDGIGKRLKAWEKANSISLMGLPFVISNMATQINDKANVSKIIQVIEEIFLEANSEPSIIFIDTLARNFGSGDENSAENMNAFIRHIDEIKNRWQATVIIVHHSGHQEKMRARGSSVLRAAIDQEYSVKKSNSSIIFQSTKTKDGPDPEPLNFELETLELDISDVNGAKEIGAFLKLSKDNQKSVKLSSSQKNIFTILRKLIVDKGEYIAESNISRVSISVFKAEVKDNSILGSVKPDSARRSAMRAFEELKKQGLVTVSDDFIYLTDKPDKIGQK